MTAFILPVSGITVLLRQPSGAQDLLLTEVGALDVRVALSFVDAISCLPEGSPVDWNALSMSDLDAALLAVRQLVLGDRVRSSVLCGCGERVDIAFSIEAYLTHHTPRRPRGLEAATDAPWFRLAGTEGSFRLPSCGDQIAVTDRADAAIELTRRCVRPERVSARTQRRFEAAMALLAPSLYGEVEGVCPECATRLQITFDPTRYVLSELREHAAFVYEEVHLIAGHYRWSERDILALPRTRRARYADLVHDARAGA